MSYSSCGVADGGSVASRTFPAAPDGTLPAAPDGALRGGGNCSPPGGGLATAVVGCGAATGTDGAVGGLPASVLRSSGAPAARPPGAPTGMSFPAVETCGVATASLPSTRGAPGAFGCRDGS